MAVELTDEASAAWGLAMQFDPELERLTVRALDSLWSPNVEAEIVAGLELLCGDGYEQTRLEARRALDDLRTRGRASEIALAVAQNLAMHLGNEDQRYTGDQPFAVCVCCLDEIIERSPEAEHREIALRCAPLLLRDAAVPEVEVRAAMKAGSLAAIHGGRPGAIARVLATGARREAVRARAARIARLACDSEPHFAAALASVLAEPPPADPAEDPLWLATCAVLVGDSEGAMN